MRGRGALSLAEARRVALAAQGFARPTRLPNAAAIRGTLARLGALQIDSVNVFERSRYLPLFSRLGAYDRATLDRLLQHGPSPRARAQYTEYLAHEASIIPLTDRPLWDWKMRELAARSDQQEFRQQHSRVVRDVLAQFTQRAGPLRSSEIEHCDNVSRGGGWWNHNVVRRSVEHLFRVGELVPVGRIRFERAYCLAAQADPAGPAPERAEAIRELIRRAGHQLGIGTLDDIADYYRLPLADARLAVADLCEAGEFREVTVTGWDKPAFVDITARLPRRIDGATVLSPFDPVCWYRPRALRLFGFHYRIEIYTPAARRQYGYYVLPVLIGADLVGRVDLKSDRQAGALRVQSAWIEPSFEHQAADLGQRLAPVLTDAAAWQGLDDVVVRQRGSWSGELARALR